MKKLCSRSKISKEDWLKLRKKGLFSTDSAAILGLSKWKSSVDVWTEKRTEEVDISDSEYLRDGRELEPFCAARFMTNEGILAQPFEEVVVHDTHEWLGANLDYFVDTEKGVGGLELKTTDSRNWDEWESGVPPQYHCQVMHQLAVTGWGYSYIQCWAYGRGTRVFLVERDEEIISNLIEILGEFWEKYVKTGAPPPAIEPSSDYYRKVYPRALQGEALLPDKAGDLFLRWDNLKEQKTSLESEEDAIKTELMAIMGGHSLGVYGSRKVAWPEVNTNRFDTEAFKKEHSELYRKFLKTTVSRRFSIK